MLSLVAFVFAVFGAGVVARTDLEGCVSSKTIAYGGASLIWYIPETGEICAHLDCGGGRAPPKTTVPGCGHYKGTATYSPSYLPGYVASTAAAAASTTAASSSASHAPSTITSTMTSTTASAMTSSETSHETYPETAETSTKTSTETSTSTRTSTETSTAEASTNTTSASMTTSTEVAATSSSAGASTVSESKTSMTTTRVVLESSGVVAPGNATRTVSGTGRPSSATVSTTAFTGAAAVTAVKLGREFWGMALGVVAVGGML